jgi:hypothetical protein
MQQKYHIYTFMSKWTTFSCCIVYFILPKWLPFNSASGIMCNTVYSSIFVGFVTYILHAMKFIA